MPITRSNLHAMLTEVLSVAGRLRSLDDNPPRLQILAPYLDRMVLAHEGGTTLPPDDPIWKATLNADGTGPLVTEFTDEVIQGLADEAESWSNRYAAASEEMVARLGSLQEVLGDKDVGDLWNSLPDDGTSSEILEVSL